MEKGLQDQFTNIILQTDLHSEQGFSPRQIPCFRSKEPTMVFTKGLGKVYCSLSGPQFLICKLGREAGADDFWGLSFSLPSLLQALDITIAGTRPPQGIRTSRSQVPEAENSSVNEKSKKENRGIWVPGLTVFE